MGTGTATEGTLAPRAVVELGLEAIAKGDLEEFGTYLSDDATWEVMGADYMGSGPLYEGKDAVMNDFLLGLVPDVFDLTKPFKLEVQAVHGDGPVVVVEWIWSATPRDGGWYTNPYCLVISVDGGKITSVREYLPTENAKRLLFD